MIKFYQADFQPKRGLKKEPRPDPPAVRKAEWADLAVFRQDRRSPAQQRAVVRAWLIRAKCYVQLLVALQRYQDFCGRLYTIDEGKLLRCVRFRKKEHRRCLGSTLLLSFGVHTRLQCLQTYYPELSETLSSNRKKTYRIGVMKLRWPNKTTWYVSVSSRKCFYAVYFLHWTATKYQSLNQVYTLENELFRCESILHDGIC